MNELKHKVAEIAQGAAKIMDANGDGSITFDDAKYKAAIMAGKTREFVDQYDDMIEQPYNKAMRAIKISKWPGHSYWGPAFAWPWGLVTWSAIILLLVMAFAPRPSYGPINSLSSLNSNMAAIRGSLARLEALAPQIEAMSINAQESAQVIAELKEFTEQVKKTKLFRKSSFGQDWKKTVFGK